MLKRLILYLGVLVICNSRLDAQSLPVGIWTGSVAPTGEPPLPLTFEVSISGDSISILMRSGGRGDFLVNQAKLAGDTLTFSFEPGTLVHCTLVKRADASYGGECAGEDDLRAEMVMIPPAKPAGPGA